MQLSVAPPNFNPYQACDAACEEGLEGHGRRLARDTCTVAIAGYACAAGAGWAPCTDWASCTKPKHVRSGAHGLAGDGDV